MSIRSAPLLLAGLAVLLLGAFALFAGCEVAGKSPPPAALPEVPADTLTVEPEPVLEPLPSLRLHFPTTNDALLHGDEGAFYQDLERAIRGIRPHAWEGGRYGFVRTPVRTPRGYVFNQLHEGLDIRPLYRDRQGEPLDTVRAIAGGTVVYANGADNSSYGRYVVVEHTWDGAPVYSLYAHLASVAVRRGVDVEAAAPLGRLGYSGRGLGRHRAHVHLEVALLLNRHFQRWFDAMYRGRNLHGLYFGKNLAGVDPSALYLALQEEPALTFAEFVRRQPVAYRLALPGGRPLDLLTRYPWLAVGEVPFDGPLSTGAWVVGFTREGVPVEIGRQDEPVAQPEVVDVADEVWRGHLSTGGVLARSGSTYRLTPSGRALAALLVTTAEGPPRWF